MGRDTPRLQARHQKAVCKSSRNWVCAAKRQRHASWNKLRTTRAGLMMSLTFCTAVCTPLPIQLQVHDSAGVSATVVVAG